MGVLSFVSFSSCRMLGALGGASERGAPVPSGESVELDAWGVAIPAAGGRLTLLGLKARPPRFLNMELMAGWLVDLRAGAIEVEWPWGIEI